MLVAGICAAHVRYPDGAFGHGTYILITVAAAVVAWIGVIRQPRRLRFAWICVAVGVTCSGAGDSIYYVMGLVSGNLADVSIADGFWLAAYVGLAVGVSSLIVGGFGRRRVDIDGLLDIGSFAVLAVVIVTQFSVVHDLVTDTSYSISTRMIWTAYPVLDAALLGVVAQAMLSKRLRNRSGFFLGLGAGLWLISDFTSLLMGSSDCTRGGWMSAGWPGRPPWRSRRGRARRSTIRMQPPSSSAESTTGASSSRSCRFSFPH